MAEASEQPTSDATSSGAAPSEGFADVIGGWRRWAAAAVGGDPRTQQAAIDAGIVTHALGGPVETDATAAGLAEAARFSRRDAPSLGTGWSTPATPLERSVRLLQDGWRPLPLTSLHVPFPPEDRLFARAPAVHCDWASGTYRPLGHWGVVSTGSVSTGSVPVPLLIIIAVFNIVAGLLTMKANADAAIPRWVPRSAGMYHLTSREIAYCCAQGWLCIPLLEITNVIREPDGAVIVPTTRPPTKFRTAEPEVHGEVLNCVWRDAIAKEHRSDSTSFRHQWL